MVFLAAYFPITSFIAGVKNDILTGYLPVRFFMSESLSEGYMPWWNPYVNFGIPQYADMSSGFWSPVTWVIAGTVGYNIYSITGELLIYILLGCWGMYKCGELFNWHKDVKLIAAISYLCCGYIVGHLQHLNWIAGAGFLPWCFWAYNQLFKSYSIKRLAVSVILFYLLISASHPGIIIGSIYFFTFYSVYLYFSTKKSSNSQTTIWNFSKPIILQIIWLLLISSALIISYTEILPFITRGVKIASSTPVMNSTTIQSWLSFIFPLSTAKNNSFFCNDISLRNNYLGLALFIFLMIRIPGGKRKSLFFLSTGLFFLILSSNTFIYTYCIKFLPLLSYVRLNGEFRIFAIFLFIISAAGNLQEHQKIEVKSSHFKRATFLLGLFIFSVITWAGFKIFLTRESIFFTPISFMHLSPIPFLKTVAEKLSFYDALFFQGLIQLPMIFLISKYVILKKSRCLLFIVIADLSIATLFNLPYTGAGTKSPRELQSLLNASPRGIPIPQLYPLSANSPGVSGINSVLGSWSFYNKQPGTIHQSAYPIEFKNEKETFQNHIRFLKNKAFLFYSYNITDDSLQAIRKNNLSHFISAVDENIELLAFSPTHILSKITVSQPGYLVLLYQNYPHWECSLNGQIIKPETYLNAFIKINFEKPGVFLVDFSFRPKIIKIWMFVSNISFILLLAVALFPACKKKSSLQHN